MAVKKLKSILWVLALFPYFLLASGYACNSTLSTYLSCCALGMELFFVIYLTYFLTNIAKIRLWKSLLWAICALILYAVIFILSWLIWFEFFAKWEYRPGPTEQPMTITKPELRRFHIERIAKGFRYFEIQIPDDSKYNTFILFQKTFPDKLKICGSFFIPPKSIDYVSAELYLKAIDNKNLQIFLRRGRTEGGWCMSQVLQGCSGTKYKEKDVQWREFFFKTTNESDGKFKSEWNDLAEGEAGFFIYPLCSSTSLSPDTLEKIKTMLNNQEK